MTYRLNLIPHFGTEKYSHGLGFFFTFCIYTMINSVEEPEKSAFQGGRGVGGFGIDWHIIHTY